MGTIGSLRIAAAVALLAVACGSHPGLGTASGARVTPSAGTRLQTSCPSEQIAPHFPPAAPSNRNLEIVSLKGSPKYVVRDITDILHPTTLSTLENTGPMRFVSASELSIASPELVRMPLSGSPRTTVASPCFGMLGFAWSPDGRSAAYLTDRSDYSVTELHLIDGGYDRAATTTPFVPITDCGPPCEDFVDLRLLYSPNGSYVSAAVAWSSPFIRIWTSDGRLVQTIDADPADTRSGPTMSVWSGNSLLFRDKQGIQAWRDGKESLRVPGVAWIRPNASPAGGQVVYAAKDQTGAPNVFILDTASGNVRMIAKLRSEPAFLNSHLVWYKEEGPCVSGDSYPCGPLATKWTGKTYIYDLQDNTETESLIAAVWDVWPHPA